MEIGGRKRWSDHRAKSELAADLWCALEACVDKLDMAETRRERRLSFRLYVI